GLLSWHAVSRDGARHARDQPRDQRERPGATRADVLVVVTRGARRPGGSDAERHRATPASPEPQWRRHGGVCRGGAGGKAIGGAAANAARMREGPHAASPSFETPRGMRGPRDEAGVRRLKSTRARSARPASAG